MARSYLKDKEITKKKGVHTVYTGNGEPIGTRQHKVKSVKFWSGINKGMEGTTFDQLKDLGHAVSNKPSEDEE